MYEQGYKFVIGVHPQSLKCHASIFHQYFWRRFSLWSMKKDPDLESALSRNRRWVVNNQIKNIILRCPNQVAPIDYLQKKFKSLDLQGKALNWVKKYPCCFEVHLENDKYFCQLTKRMKFLVDEEESVRDLQEPVFVKRLAKLLMMSRNKRLSVMKINELKRNFGFPDDYLLRIVPKHTDMFRVVNYTGRRSSMDIELISWNPDFAVSAVEMLAQKENREPCFTCSLPENWMKSWERFREFNSTPYISPYVELTDESLKTDKRTIGLVHELLSLTLWKKVSIAKLGHFRREFCLPEKLNVLLLKHPGIFYVSNKYQIYTVLLREGYCGSEMVEKDPLVVVKEKFGELMQEGLHEYNRRHHQMNLEKKKKNNKGIVAVGEERMKRGSHETDTKDDESGDLGGIFDAEERKRFYDIETLDLRKLDYWDLICTYLREDSEVLKRGRTSVWSSADKSVCCCCFTKMKAKELRKKIVEYPTFDHIMYHSTVSILPVGNLGSKLNSELSMHLPNGSRVFYLNNSTLPSQYVKEVIWDAVQSICGNNVQRCVGIVADKHRQKASENLELENNWMLRITKLSENRKPGLWVAVRLLFLHGTAFGFNFHQASMGWLCGLVAGLQRAQKMAYVAAQARLGNREEMELCEEE
ncbi:ubiquitin carboxyl-terminal hydrolase family protein [Striga asiatica]|uniref:Ubiquitin carboxyl-terminal hydrolase family protein n=1 Tax=Striga asiatica TaxID=4170 RepID=A0A5A7QZR9_STRAF|nr:ubiquitin carboxyl-terminal hydrolase family protein [Striga asiatica]